MEAKPSDPWPTLLSFSVQSQNEVHEKFGGIVPELASRAHLQNILPCLRKVLDESGLELHDFHFFSATDRPGLVGSLLIGHCAAKTLACLFDRPFIGVNHIEGHLCSLFIESQPKLPLLALMVSGGHTSLYRVDDFDNFTLIGETLDDAVGEAFDKGAKLLGLGFPGGPQLELAARAWPASDLPLPDPSRPIINFIKFGSVQTKDLDFSFSGLKSELVRIVQKRGSLSALDVSELAFHYQEALFRHLIQKVSLALTQDSYKSLAVVGGVASNLALRNKLEDLRSKCSLSDIVVPRASLCTDNAAMIGFRAYRHFLNNEFSSLRSDIHATTRPQKKRKAASL